MSEIKQHKKENHLNITQIRTNPANCDNQEVGSRVFLTDPRKNPELDVKFLQRWDPVVNSLSLSYPEVKAHYELGLMKDFAFTAAGQFLNLDRVQTNSMTADIQQNSWNRSTASYNQATRSGSAFFEKYPRNSSGSNPFGRPEHVMNSKADANNNTEQTVQEHVMPSGPSMSR